jgi:uncharacterized membrane protein (DUF485 family)
MSNPYPLARMARFTAWAAYLIMAALVVMMAAFLTKPDELPQMLKPMFTDITLPTQFSTAQTTATMILGVLVICMSIYVVYQIYVMAGLLRRPPLLNHENAEQVCRIGTGLLILLGVTLLSYPTFVLIATWDNTPGARSIAISVSFGQVAMGLIGCLIYLIGRAMADSASEAEEFRTFI